MSDLGTTLSCVFDCTDEYAVVSGRTCLAQALARRLVTARGGLIDDPNYGFDLTQFLNADMSPTDIAQAESGTEAECLKDERVLAADATVAVTPAQALIVTITITEADGPFSLVLAVSDVTVQLLTVTS